MCSSVSPGHQFFKIMKMNRFLKILIPIILLIALSLSALWIYVSINGKRLITDELEKAVGAKVVIQDIRVVFPLSIVVKGFSLGDNISASQISVSPNLLGIFKKSGFIKAFILKDPKIKIVRQADESFDFGFSKDVQDKLAVSAVSNKKTKAGDEVEDSSDLAEQARFYPDKLELIDGNVEVIDRSVSGDGTSFKMNFSSLNLTVTRTTPFNMARMDLKGTTKVLAEGKEAGEVGLAGWVDLVGMNMDVQFLLKDAKVPSFAPYLKKLFGGDIKSGDVSLKADLKAKNDNLNAACHIEIKNVAFADKDQTDNSQDQSVNTAQMIFSGFNSLFSTDGGIVLDFSVDTKMSNPKFENVRLKGNFIQAKIGDIISKSPDERDKEFKEIGKQFEDIGKQFKEMFKKKD